MFHLRPRAGNAGVATPLAVGQGFALARLALDVHPPALRLQARLALAIDIAFVAIQIPAGVEPIEHVVQMAGIIFSGGAALYLAEQLLFLNGAGRELVAKVRLAVLLGPAGLGILLSALRRRPVARRGLLLEKLLLLLAAPRRREWLKCRVRVNVNKVIKNKTFTMALGTTACESIRSLHCLNLQVSVLSVRTDLGLLED